MAQPLRLLILEDRAADAELMVAELRRQGFAPEWRRVETEAEFAAALSPDLDVILSDYNLAGFDAIAALRQVKERALSVPVIVVTGAVGEETAAQCIREGAADYLLKDRLARLGLAVTQAMARQRLEEERLHIEKALIASQAELATIFDHAPVAMVVLGRNRRIARANQAAGLLAGRPVGDAFGRLPGAAFDCLNTAGSPEGCGSGPACDACPLRSVVVDTLEHGTPHHAVECSLPFGGGSSGNGLTLLVSTSPLETSMGRLAVVSLEDITAREQAAERERKLGHLLATIREINQLIVRETNREWLLAETCRIMVEQGGFRMAWVGRLDEASGEIRPVAVAGHEDGYLQAIGVRCDDSPLGRGPVGTASRAGRTVVVDDIEADASMAPWRDAARARGYRSKASVPLQVNERPFGVVSAYSDRPSAFDADVVNLLEELAADLGFALAAMDATAERQRAVEALRASEERYRQLFEAESDAILLFDSESGRVVEANSAAEALYGYDHEELLGLAEADLAVRGGEHLWASPDPDAAVEAVARSPVRRHRRKDGSEFPVEITGRFFRWKGRQVHIAAIRDISERLRADEAIRRDLGVRTAVAEISRVVLGGELRIEDVAGLVLEHARQLTGSDHGFVSEVDPHTGDNVGHTLTEMLAGACDVKGEDRRIVFPRGDDGLYPGLWGHALNTQLPFIANHPAGHETARGTPAGHIQLEQFLAVPVVSGGELLGAIALANAGRDYLATDVDVVQRLAEYFAVAIRRARWEGALRESEDRYRSFFEEDLTGDYITSRDGTLVECNPSFVRIFGFSSREEAMATNVTALYPDPLARARLLRLLEERGRLEYYEMELRRRDGRPVHVIANLVGLRDGAGRLEQVKGYLFDQTERRALEEQLRHAQRMEAVGRLAGGVAHDFNNLLQAFMGQVQLIARRVNEPERVTEAAEELEQQVHRGASLTRQLLLFSRRETAQWERLDLNEVIRGQVKLLRRLVRENIALHLRLLGEPLMVDGDHGQLEQVVMNLVVNASDVLEQGGEVVITSGVDGQGDVWLAIEDNGPGVPQDLRQRIFEPFFTTKAAGQGTGLGLSVVHGIVAQHRGRIALEDRPGGGSIFRVTLPRAWPDGDASTVRADAAQGELPSGHGERVLVVEDEPAAREGLVEMLGMLGYAPQAVGSAEEAASLAEAPAFAVLLTDLMLPGKSGAELAGALRERWPDLRVLLMSGYTEDEAVRRGVSGGEVRFLQKPFDMATLATELRDILTP